MKVCPDTGRKKKMIVTMHTVDAAKHVITPRSQRVSVNSCSASAAQALAAEPHVTVVTGCSLCLLYTHKNFVFCNVRSCGPWVDLHAYQSVLSCPNLATSLLESGVPKS